MECKYYVRSHKYLGCTCRTLHDYSVVRMLAMVAFSTEMRILGHAPSLSDSSCCSIHAPDFSVLVALFPLFPYFIFPASFIRSIEQYDNTAAMHNRVSCARMLNTANLVLVTLARILNMSKRIDRHTVRLNSAERINVGLAHARPL